MHLLWLNFFTGAYDKYKEFFKIPYFIFVRDTLSYLALLAMHLAICVQPSQVSFSGLEWVILVFFLGRLLNEVKQIIDMRRTRSANQEKLTLGDYIRYTTSYVFRLSFFPSFLPSFLSSFLPSLLSSNFLLPTCHPSHLAFSLPAFLPSFLPVFVSSFLPFFIILLTHVFVYLFSCLLL